MFTNFPRRRDVLKKFTKRHNKKKDSQTTLKGNLLFEPKFKETTKKKSSSSINFIKPFPYLTSNCLSLSTKNKIKYFSDLLSSFNKKNTFRSSKRSLIGLLLARLSYIDFFVVVVYQKISKYTEKRKKPHIGIQQLLKKHVLSLKSNRQMCCLWFFILAKCPFVSCSSYIIFVKIIYLQKFN